MSNDLISRQAAIDICLQYCPDDDGICSKNGDDLRNMLDEIEALPTVDAVQVVRCEDCKEWTKMAGDEGFSVGRCEFLEHDLVMNKGFCAWGVRKDDGDNH